MAAHCELLCIDCAYICIYSRETKGVFRAGKGTMAPRTLARTLGLHVKFFHDRHLAPQMTKKWLGSPKKEIPGYALA